MEMRAYGDKVLCKLLLSKIKSEGGIYYPKQNPTQQAVVLSVGEDFKPDLKPDDKIIVELHGGIPVIFKGEKYMLYTESEVLAKIEDE